MKLVNAFCLAFTVFGLVTLYQYRRQIRWYLRNKATVDAALDTADALSQVGVLP